MMSEPRTAAGRALLNALRPWAERFPDKFLPGWEDDILAIEAEARQPVAGLSVERLARAMHESQRWCDGTENPDWRNEDETGRQATAMEMHGGAARSVAAEYGAKG